ncbi:GFA family protein [Oleiphilus sp. HI0066]|uniref:GFA family protein n=2 Tax=Oleiphilus TaxID=141450 RepID=UPI000B01E210
MVSACTQEAHATAAASASTSELLVFVLLIAVIALCCLKTAGGGGYAINLGADAKTLKIEGEENITVYHALIKDEETGETNISPAERRFCKKCGSSLWRCDPRWPELVHPFASVIDTELPIPPEHSHMMLNSKASWVEVDKQTHDKCFAEYPDESLADWHLRLNLNA